MSLPVARLSDPFGRSSRALLSTCNVSVFRFHIAGSSIFCGQCTPRDSRPCFPPPAELAYPYPDGHETVRFKKSVRYTRISPSPDPSCSDAKSELSQLPEGSTCVTRRETNSHREQQQQPQCTPLPRYQPPSPLPQFTACSNEKKGRGQVGKPESPGCGPPHDDLQQAHRLLRGETKPGVRGLCSGERQTGESSG